MARRARILVAFAVILVAIGAFLRLGRTAEPPGADPDNPRMVERGKVVYEQECAPCHGDHLQGEPNWRRRKPNGQWPAPPHDQTGHTWHHSDKVLFDVTKFGIQAMIPDRESDMPAF